MQILVQPLIAAAASVLMMIPPQHTSDPIVENTNGTEEIVEAQDVEITCATWVAAETPLLIHNEKSLKTVIARSNNDQKVKCQIPNIDFERYSLIIAFTTSGGCDAPVISKEVKRNSTTNHVVMNVELEQQGYCKMLHQVPLWVIIPKVDATSTVALNVDRKIKSP